MRQAVQIAQLRHHMQAVIDRGYRLSLRRFALLLLALSIPFAFAACGFQLRGEQTLPFATLAISGSPSYVTVSQIKTAVGKSPSTRVVDAGKADAVLYVMNETQEKIISALSAAGKVREYELRLRVSFRLTDKQGNERIPETEITLFRLLTYDESQILSKGQEEALLYQDMQNDVTTQIMRRIAAVKPGV